MLDHYLLTATEAKFVTNKPHTLIIGCGTQRYECMIKISEAKIKRRSNDTQVIESHSLSSDVSLSITSSSWMYSVRTKGGKTAGRPPQQYIQMKRMGVYRITSIYDVTAVSLRVADVTYELPHWTPEEHTHRMASLPTSPTSRSRAVMPREQYLHECKETTPIRRVAEGELSHQPRNKKMKVEVGVKVEEKVEHVMIPTSSTWIPPSEHTSPVSTTSTPSPSELIESTPMTYGLDFQLASVSQTTDQLWYTVPSSHIHGLLSPLHPNQHQQPLFADEVDVDGYGGMLDGWKPAEQVDDFVGSLFAPLSPHEDMGMEVQDMTNGLQVDISPQSIASPSPSSSPTSPGLSQPPVTRSFSSLSFSSDSDLSLEEQLDQRLDELVDSVVGTGDMDMGMSLLDQIQVQDMPQQAYVFQAQQPIEYIPSQVQAQTQAAEQFVFYPPIQPVMQPQFAAVQSYQEHVQQQQTMVQSFSPGPSLIPQQQVQVQASPGTGQSQSQQQVQVQISPGTAQISPGIQQQQVQVQAHVSPGTEQSQSQQQQVQVQVSPGTGQISPGIQQGQMQVHVSPGTGQSQSQQLQQVQVQASAGTAPGTEQSQQQIQVQISPGIQQQSQQQVQVQGSPGTGQQQQQQVQQQQQQVQIQISPGIQQEQQQVQVQASSGTGTGIGTGIGMVFQQQLAISPTSQHSQTIPSSISSSGGGSLPLDGLQNGLVTQHVIHDTSQHVIIGASVPTSNSSQSQIPLHDTVSSQLSAVIADPVTQQSVQQQVTTPDTSQLQSENQLVYVDSSHVVTQQVTTASQLQQVTTPDTSQSQSITQVSARIATQPSQASAMSADTGMERVSMVDQVSTMSADTGVQRVSMVDTSIPSSDGFVRASAQQQRASVAQQLMSTILALSILPNILHMGTRDDTNDGNSRMVHHSTNDHDDQHSRTIRRTVDTDVDVATHPYTSDGTHVMMETSQPGYQQQYNQTDTNVVSSSQSMSQFQSSQQAQPQTQDQQVQLQTQVNGNYQHVHTMVSPSLQSDTIVVQNTQQFTQQQVQDSMISQRSSQIQDIQQSTQATWASQDIQQSTQATRLDISNDSTMASSSQQSSQGRVEMVSQSMAMSQSQNQSPGLAVTALISPLTISQQAQVQATSVSQHTQVQTQANISQQIQSQVQAQDGLLQESIISAVDSGIDAVSETSIPMLQDTEFSAQGRTPAMIMLSPLSLSSPLISQVQAQTGSQVMLSTSVVDTVLSDAVLASPSPSLPMLQSDVSSHQDIQSSSQVSSHQDMALQSSVQVSTSSPSLVSNQLSHISSIQASTTQIDASLSTSATLITPLSLSTPLVHASSIPIPIQQAQVSDTIDTVDVTIYNMKQLIGTSMLMVSIITSLIMMGYNHMKQDEDEQIDNQLQSMDEAIDDTQQQQQSSSQVSTSSQSLVFNQLSHVSSSTSLSSSTCASTLLITPLSLSTPLVHASSIPIQTEARVYVPTISQLIEFQLMVCMMITSIVMMGYKQIKQDGDENLQSINEAIDDTQQQSSVEIQSQPSHDGSNPHLPCTDLQSTPIQTQVSNMVSDDLSVIVMSHVISSIMMITYGTSNIWQQSVHGIDDSYPSCSTVGISTLSTAISSHTTSSSSSQMPSASLTTGIDAICMILSLCVNLDISLSSKSSFNCQQPKSSFNSSHQPILPSYHSCDRIIVSHPVVAA